MDRGGWGRGRISGSRSQWHFKIYQQTFAHTRPTFRYEERPVRLKESPLDQAKAFKPRKLTSFGKITSIPTHTYYFRKKGLKMKAALHIDIKNVNSK